MSIESRVAVLGELVSLAKLIDHKPALGRIYERLVGYDAHEADPEASADELRDLVFGVAKEECVNLGVHVSRIGLLS